MVSAVFKNSMIAGFMFNKSVQDDEHTYEWNASEACAEFAKRIIDNAENLKISVEDSFYKLRDNLLVTLSNDDGDHDWDDYCRGFLAGQIIGLPTDDNLAKIEKAEELWKDADTYGYYHECLEEVA